MTSGPGSDLGTALLGDQLEAAADAGLLVARTDDHADRRRAQARLRALRHRGNVRVEPIVPSLSPFQNEPVLELRRAAVRAQLTDAMVQLDDQLPVAVPVAIGSDLRAGQELVSTDPGEPERPVAVAAAATRDEVDAAVGVAQEGARQWGATATIERAGALIAAAGWMRERRLELAALEVRECAKPWPEADADVCEAIDFLEYYARGAVRVGRGPTAASGPRRAQRTRLRPTRGHGGDLALELSAGHRLRDDAPPPWPPATPWC